MIHLLSNCVYAQASLILVGMFIMEVSVVSAPHMALGPKVRVVVNQLTFSFASVEDIMARTAALEKEAIAKAQRVAQDILATLHK